MLDNQLVMLFVCTISVTGTKCSYKHESYPIFIIKYSYKVELLGSVIFSFPLSLVCFLLTEPMAIFNNLASTLVSNPYR